MIAKVKKVSKLEADVAKLQKTISELHSIHQTEIERLCGIHLAEIECKDTFCEVEKVQLLSKLQASYNAKLPSVYLE